MQLDHLVPNLVGDFVPPPVFGYLPSQLACGMFPFPDSSPCSSKATGWVSVPRGEDAQIPEIQLERLRWLGGFLADAGEAIYGTRPWVRAEGTTREGVAVRFTQREGVLYATLLGTPPTRSVTLVDLPGVEPKELRLLGSRAPVHAKRLAADLAIEIGQDWANRPAHSLRLGRIRP